jgi:hypothetical protein
MSADINLDNINVDLALSGAADFGLDAVAGALANLGVEARGGLDLDVGLDDVRITELATIRAEASIKEIAPINTNSTVDLGLDDVKVDLGLDNVKVDLGLDDIRIRELPPIRFELSFRPIRVHLPLNYSFCLELLGVRLFKFSVCGEGMAIGEDYQPRETERCR